MSLQARVQRNAEDRKALIGKGDFLESQRQRKGLREISNIPSHITKKVADLKISTSVSQRTVDKSKFPKITPASSFQKNSNLKPQDKFLKKGEELSVRKETIEDIDKLYSNDVFLVSEYAKDVYSYLLSLENKFVINKWPLPNSKITERMRIILVDWLIDVHVDLNLLQETIHHTVAILDRYLQVDSNLEKSIFQLVGISALSLACKYEETLSPCSDDYIYLCKNAFHKKDLLEMEKKILSALNYDLGRPISIMFLRRYNMAARANKLQHCYSKYFIDSVLLDTNFCHIKPSLIAAAAAFIAMCIVNKAHLPSLWNSSMIHYTSYTLSEVKPVSSQMASSIIKGCKSEYDSVRRKYAQTSFLRVSLKIQASMEILKSVARNSSPVDNSTSGKQLLCPVTK